MAISTLYFMYANQMKQSQLKYYCLGFLITIYAYFFL